MAKSKGRLLSELAEAPKNEDYADVNALPNTGNKVGDQAFVEETDRLYIWNGSGWYNIALINTTPTWDSGGQPAGSYVLDTDSPQDATTITLAASDPEGLPISYSYVTGGSMDSIATISQDSSVFTITPKTIAQAPDGGTGSITFRASDGVNILPQVSSFTLNFITTITNSKYTTLLATATGTSDNDNIIDASTNNRSITVNGDVHAGTFSPYRSGGYSTYFDGTGDWLTLTSTALGNGDFTVEAWVWLDSLKDYNVIYDDRVTGSSAAGLALGVDSTGAPYLYTNNGFQITSSQTCTAKTWHHISLVRSSGVITIYLDGTSGGTYSSSANFTDTNLGIGVARTYTVTSQFGGYISDVRAVVGTAIYISAFGPPTERLTAITNTSLLTCHLPYIADGSTNNYSITVNGDVSTKPFSPYDYSVEYSATDHGGSVAFDGTGDYLLTSALIPATDNFTIEGWVYSTSTDDSQTICGQRTNSGNGRFAIYIKSGGNINFGQTDSSVSGLEYTSSNSEALNKWCHFVLMRTSSNIAFYVNGERVLNTTSGTFEQTNFEIGTDVELDGVGLNYGLYGFVSDLRVSLSAKYSEGTSVTIPTTPLSSTGAALHIKGTDASIIDKAQGSNLKLFGNTTGSTTQAKFANTKSMYFDGTGDYIDLGSATNFNFGTNSFTIEAWVRFNSLSRQSIINCYDGTDNSFDLQYRDYNNVNHISWTGQSAHWAATPSNEISSGTWYHIAAVRDYSAGTIKIYIDGTQKASASDTRNYSTSQNLIIGAQSNSTGAANMNGYIQDLRITKGLARYTANFTPPTASLEG